MDIFLHIAERKIQEAMQRGEFDNLPNRGRKLDLQVDPFVPVELHMGYKILKNAGMVPEEITLGREIRNLENLLANCPSSDGESELQGRIRQKVLLLNLLRERNGRSIALQDYLGKLETT